MLSPNATAAKFSGSPQDCNINNPEQAASAIGFACAYHNRPNVFILLDEHKRILRLAIVRQYIVRIVQYFLYILIVAKRNFRMVVYGMVYKISFSRIYTVVINVVT
jgi:hypothetical protein